MRLTPKKPSNGLIGTWKKELEKDKVANCRNPSCTFQGKSIEELRQHFCECLYIISKVSITRIIPLLIQAVKILLNVGFPGESI